MTLSERYQQALQQHNMVEDAAQRRVVTQLQQIIDELAEPNTARRLRRSAPALVDLCRLSKFLFSQCFSPPVKGMYLWGGVGRGKTWLMHLFYETLPFEQKQRLHFHAFMQSVHEQLGAMKRQKNPLKHIARRLARDYRVICLDEFIVTNITDAMLLGGLLEWLFQYGVTLVATSNRVPDDLYLNGLQRERFLPAIELIKAHTHVVQLDNGIDHRLALLEGDDLYYHPLNDDIRRQFEQRFDALCSGNAVRGKQLTLFNRMLQTVACADDIVWFEFDTICSAPRAAQDYVEIAQQFHTVFVSGVPEMDAAMDDKCRRFIYLIDALYDSRVKLVVSAQVLPEELYLGRLLAFAFKRTCSRLIEMRSAHYLAEPHQPQQEKAASA